MNLGYELKVISKELERHLDLTLKKYDLTSSQYSVLRFLIDSERLPVTQKAICEALELHHATVIGLLQRLSEKGFVYTQTDQINRKYKNVYLTEKGLDMAGRIRIDRKVVDDQLTSGFSPDEAESLYEFIIRLKKNVKEI